MKTGIHVDADECMKHLQQAEDLISNKKPDILVFASKQMKKDSDAAFRSKTNPQTGRRWSARKHSYPWGLLTRTGTLKGLMNFGWGVKTKDKKHKVFGKIADSFYLGGYSRGGGGAFLNAKKPGIVVAGAIFYGRKRARSAAEMRTRTRNGITRTWLHGGGTRLRTAASTGVVPPRPFMGIGQMSRFKVRRFAQGKLKRIFN